MPHNFAGVLRLGAYPESTTFNKPCDALRNDARRSASTMGPIIILDLP
jgi:hypothetical protein